MTANVDSQFIFKLHEHETLNLRVVGSSPTLGAHYFFCIFFKAGFPTANVDS